MWYFVTHLVMLLFFGVIFSLAGFPEFIMPVAPLAIFLATLFSMIIYHFMHLKREDIELDVLFSCIVDVSILVLSPSIYMFWFGNTEAWIRIHQLVTFRSLMTSLMIVVAQAFMPLVYFRYVAEYPEAPAPTPATVKPVQTSAFQKTDETVKGMMKVEEAHMFTVSLPSMQKIKIALDVFGRPIELLEYQS